MYRLMDAKLNRIQTLLDARFPTSQVNCLTKNISNQYSKVAIPVLRCDVPFNTALSVAWFSFEIKHQTRGLVLKID